MKLIEAVSKTPYHYTPWKFFTLVAVFSWTPWLMAIYTSQHPTLQTVTGILCLLGLLGPCLALLVTWWTTPKGKHDREIKEDIKRRLKDFSGIASMPLLGILIGIVIVLLLATGIAVVLGRDANQFHLSANFIPMLPLAIIAALLEELAWRSYGIDSLAERFSWLQTTAIFYGLWALWHVPLFFIQGMYQHGLWEMSSLYVVNFFISMIPATIISMWLYIKTKRSIWAAVIFHFTLVATAELLQTEQFTKCIITLLLLGIAVCLLKTIKQQPAAKLPIHSPLQGT